MHHTKKRYADAEYCKVIKYEGTKCVVTLISLCSSGAVKQRELLLFISNFINP